MRVICVLVSDSDSVSDSNLPRPMIHLNCLLVHNERML